MVRIDSLKYIQFFLLLQVLTNWFPIPLKEMDYLTGFLSLLKRMGYLTGFPPPSRGRVREGVSNILKNLTFHASVLQAVKYVKISHFH
jgi:hypothetical protein